jgi:type IVB pilus formation R64 PilN family outer membrane protein
VLDQQPVHIVYPHGDLEGLLDAAAARFGVYWKYADGVIVFFYTDTRVYQVSAIPGDSKLDANIVSSANNSGTPSTGLAGGSSGGGSSGSGGTPTVSSDNTTNIVMNAQLSVYTGLQAAIKAMLSPVGAVIGSPGTGSISVTDTPDVLERVGEFMEQQNRVLSRQVLVNVTVLSVTLSADDSYGINWNAVYQALGTSFGITSAFSSLVSGATQFSATVITPNSRASTTSAMISALSDQGTVRRKTSASVTTLNDQPVPVQVATQQSYLAQVSTTNTLNVGSQTALTPGTVTTGFNLTLLPHILDDGTVMMQFYTNISSLESLTQFTSGGQSIQLPTIDTRNFLQRISIKSGQTLVISGYEGIADQGTQQGVGTPATYAFGGGYNTTHSREIIVILISPITMNGS